MALKFAVPIILVLYAYSQKGFAGDFDSVHCEPLKKVENGKILYPRMNHIQIKMGDLLHLSCNPPYVIEGNPSTTCCYNGKWRPLLGTCKLPQKPVDFCQPYVYNKSMSLHYNAVLKKIPLNTTIVLECPYGQRIQGNSISKCVKGIWQPTLGTCVEED